MAVTAYTVTTSASGVNKIWRKIQGKLATALQYECEEFNMVDDLPSYDIDVSAREITVPLDINEGAGVASIAEGDFEAVPSSPNVDEITLNYVEFSKRFTASTVARILDENQAKAALKRQIVHQGTHAMRDLARHFSDQFYGSATAVLCQTTTAATQSSGAYTLANMYGTSSLGSAAQLADKFRVGDQVAIVSAGAIKTNGLGVITAISKTTPSITVTWAGSVVSVSGDSIVKANSMRNDASTVASCDYNKGLVGFEDMFTATSLHSLSGSTQPNWNAAYSDTTSGRFSGIKLHRAKQEIANAGGGKANMVVIDQGVRRDLLSLQQAALRFDDPFALEIDGEIKSKGVTFFDSRRVPSGRVYVYDKSSIKKLNVMPTPDGGGMAWGDAIRMENQAGYVFPINWVTQLVCLNRKNLAYFSSQTTS
jgi:hypothetical protein